MKLEVGMYVRINGGIIDKINSQDDIDYYFSKEDIIKASHNIIDLIEAGDYVNDIEVFDLIDNQIPKLLITDNGCISNREIKSIVTKEQFESISYKVDK